MPPEPLPWNRKDFFKEKKYERFDSVGYFARYHNSSHQGSREFYRRESDDFPRPLGHGRSSERRGDEESIFRPSMSRSEGRYSRNSHEVRGPVSQMDWRGRSREDIDGSINSFSRHHELGVQRSVSDLVTAHPRSNLENSPIDHLHTRDERHKNGNFDGLGTGHRFEKDKSGGSIPWNPVKWNRSSSLSSRGSGLSESSSSRSTRSESKEIKAELPSRGIIPVRSLSVEPSGCVPSARNEETSSRKKQRLGWGQGLAKYEKRRVEGPDERPDVSTRTSQDTIPSLSDRSPRVAGVSICSSPPSSFACSSSPGLEEKSLNKSSSIDCHTSSPNHEFQYFTERFSVNVENLEFTSSSKLNSLLLDLLQPEDASSGDSKIMRSTGMNKLLLLKTGFLTAVEKVESEVDKCENELKLLNTELEINGASETVFEPLQVNLELKPSEIAGAVSQAVQKPSPLQVASLDVVNLDKTTLCGDTTRQNNTEVEDDIDSPGTATSKYVEPLLLEKTGFTSDFERNTGYTSVSRKVGCRSPQRESSSSIEEKSTSEPCTEDVKLTNEMYNVSHGSSDSGLLSNENIKLSESIFESNRDYARNASDELTKLLPSDGLKSDRPQAINISCDQNDLLVKEKLLARNHSRRLKERVLSLKYRALQHMWKEDMHMISIKKNRAKSQKRCEPSFKISHNGHHNHRFSVPSQCTSSAGNLSLVPTRDIVDCSSKFLSDSRLRLHRSCLKMPALMLDEKDERFSKFVTNAGLVEDPIYVEKERKMINPWTPAEKELFLEVLAMVGKDFKRIASFLDHKTTADCVEFYYKNHKSESFEKIKKLEPRKQEISYLVTSGKKWNHEVNAASLNVIGAASSVAANAGDNMKTQQSTVGMSFLPINRDRKSSSSDVPRNEREVVAADVLAGICGAVSSEAVSSCITSSIDPIEGSQEKKMQKRNSLVYRSSTPDIVRKIDCQEACSDESCGELDSVDWTDEEKSVFLTTFRTYSKNFTKISSCVGTKSTEQCQIYFSKSRKILGLDLIQFESSTPLNDGNEGSSDTEDACTVDIESAPCSMQSCTKMDVEAHIIDNTSRCDGISLINTENLKLDENNGLEQLSCEEAGLRKVTGDCCSTVKTELDICGEDNLVKESGMKITATPEMSKNIDVMVERHVEKLSCDLPVQGLEEADHPTETQNVKEQEINGTLSLNDESSSGGKLGGPGKPRIDVSTELKCILDSPADKLKEETSGVQFLVHGSGSDRRYDVKNGVGMVSSRSSSCCVVPELKTNKSSPMNGAAVPLGFSSTPSYYYQNSHERVPSRQESEVNELQQKENLPSLSANLSSRNGSSIQRECHLGESTTVSTVNMEDPGNEQHQKLGSTNIYQPYMTGHNTPNQVEPSQILRGYPLKVLNNKDNNGKVESIAHDSHSVVKNFSNVIRDLPSNQCLQQGLHQEKRSGVKRPRLSTDLPPIGKSNEQTPIIHPRSNSDTEKSRRTGDVKLFGQILSHPAPVQASSQTPTTKPYNWNASPKLSSNKSSDLNLMTSNGGRDGASLASKLESGSYSGLEGYPVRSFRFWDGNRIQTGLSSVLDSEILFPSYPPPMPVSDHQLQPLQTVVKRNDRNLGCVSVYPSSDISRTNSNRTLTDYHKMYRIDCGTKDGKQHELFSEMQRRNGCEMIPGFRQQQYQGQQAVMGGMNAMGGSGILGGSAGVCSGEAGVSDPVTAIQLHYAAVAEQYSSQAMARKRRIGQQQEDVRPGR